MEKLKSIAKSTFDKLERWLSGRQVAPTAERLALLWEQSAFQGLATSKKRKDQQVLQLEIAAGESLQQQILTALGNLDRDKLYLSRTVFEKDLERVLKAAGLKLGAPVIKAILAALGESDPGADICRDKKGNPEPREFDARK